MDTYNLSVQKKVRILNSFLDSYEKIQNINPKNNELLFACVNPKCPSHAKKRDKFCVNIAKENAHCWVCDLRLKNLSYLIKRKAPHLIDEWNQVSKTFIYERTQNLNLSKIWYDDVFRNLIPINQLSRNHPARKYVQDIRSIDIQNAVKFDIRYAEQVKIDSKVLKNNICIPSHSVQGGIDFLFFRSINTSFKYNCQTSKKEIIFNEAYIDWKSDIALSEGIFDAIKLSQRIQTIPLLGSALSEDSKLFKKILKEKPKSIVVCLDPDALAKQIKIMKMLQKRNIMVWSMETQYNDLGDSTPEEIEEAIRNIQPFNWEYNIKLNLRLI